MMKSKWLCAVAVFAFVCLLAASAGCGGGKPAERPAEKPAESAKVREISIATGGMAGTYYPIGAAIAKVITEHVPGLKVTAESTGASIANIKMLGDGKVELILAGSMTAHGAYVGADESFPRAYKEMRGLFATYPEVYQFVVRKESGLKKLGDLKGKRVVVGAPGSGTLRGATKILEEHGLTYDDFDEEFAPFADACQMLKDGQTDCIVIASGIPTAGVMEVASSIEIDLLEVDMTTLEKVIEKEPYFSLFTIPKDTYKGLSRDVLSVATPALVVTKEGVFSEEEGYNIVKAVYANEQFFKEAHVQGKYFTKDNALKGMCLPLHPGAEKYFKEIGLVK